MFSTICVRCQCSLLSNLGNLVAPRRAFRQRRNANVRGRVNSVIEEAGSRPFIPIPDSNVPPPLLSTLFRPFVFTLGFGAVSLGAAAIWQYENMRNLRRKLYWRQDLDDIDVFESIFGWSLSQRENEETIGQRFVKFRREMRKFWQDSLTEGQRVFAPILFANLSVFVAWRVPAFQRTMLRYFCSNPSNSGAVCLPMLLSTFSHYSLLHLCANMYVLHSFSGPIVKALGKEQFMAVYLTGGVISSFASLVHKVLTHRVGYSLGASGAICAVLGIFGTLLPDAQMQIIFLPTFTFSASIAIKSLMAIDTAGIVAGWKFFDHAAHLGGILFGIWWYRVGYQLIWERRELIMTWWHYYVHGGQPPSS